MFGPIPPSKQPVFQEASIQLHRDKSTGLIQGIIIKTADGPFYIAAKSYDSLLQSYTRSGQHSYQNVGTLTKSFSEKTASQDPSPPKTFEPPKPAPSETLPKQAEAQREPLASPSRGPSEANPSPGARSDEGSFLPISTKPEKSAPSDASQLAPSLLPSAKGASLPPQGQGFSGEQKTQMYQQVLLTSKLFGSSEKREAIPLSASRIFLYVEQFKSLALDCAKLEVLVRQMLAQNRGLSPEQGKQFNAALQALLKEFQGVQKQAQEMMPHLQKASGDQALPKDLQQAIAMLKERCEKSSTQMQNQLDTKLAKLAAETLKSSLPSFLEKENGAKPTMKLNAEQAPSNPQTAPELSEKTARPAMVFTSSLPASESLAQGAAEARAIGAKSSTPPPQILQSSADLQIFHDKLQKRELHAPLNISVLYPFNTKEQNGSSPSGKTRSERGGKGEQSSQGGGRGGGAHSQEMVLVPAGPTFNEGSQTPELDAFLIAAFPVTNEQFADWLNESLTEGKIKLDEKGIIRNSHRNILCKTHWAAPTSQIEAEVSQGQMSFKPLKGTQRHPVVQVSWFGAMAYCNANSFRLPTEAEWEKAAGMSADQENKFRYGFGKDEIDLSWANYRDELKPYDDNRTSPVGFYNGETVFTKGGKSYQSQHAISPFGCYDMSGNVCQWTDEEEKGLKVTKGGSYNTPPVELSVSSRTLQSPETCLPDAGFRVVLSI